MTIEVQHFSTMHSSNVATELAVRGWLELYEKGLSDGPLNFHAGMRAVLADAPNGRDMLPVGVMIWDLDEATKVVWVTLSYVKPEFRGAGVYKAMWGSLVDMAVAMGAARIESATHIRNQAMRAVAARQGRREDAVILRFDLRQ